MIYCTLSYSVVVAGPQDVLAVLGLLLQINQIGTVSVSDPDPVGSAFNLGLDPGYGFGLGIQTRIPDPDG